MLEFEVEEPTLIQKVIESVAQVCQEANVDISASGLSLSGMDAAHVSLVKLELHKSFFSRFRADQSCSLGIHFPTLLKVLKCAEHDEQVTFIHQEGSDELTLRITKPEDLKPSTYSIKLIQLDCERLDISSTDNGVKIEMTSALMQKVIRDLANFGNDIVFECPYKVTQKERYVKLHSSGDIGKGEKLLRDASFSSAVDIKSEIKKEFDDEEESAKKKPKVTSDIGDIKIFYSENFGKMDQKCSEGNGLKLTFSTQYLTVFRRGAILSDKTTISLAKNSPLEMEFSVNDFGKLSYYLAPRSIEDQNS